MSHQPRTLELAIPVGTQVVVRREVKGPHDEFLCPRDAAGVIEANLVRLNEAFKLPYIPDLIARKLEGRERSQLYDADVEFHHAEYLRLFGELEAASQVTSLPDKPTAREALHDLLIRIRLDW